MTPRSHALIFCPNPLWFGSRIPTQKDNYSWFVRSEWVLLGKTIFCCAPGAALRCPWGWLDVSVTLQDVVLSNQRNKCSLRFKDKYLRVTLMRRKVKRGFQLERPSTTRRSAVLTRIGHKSEPPTVTPRSCQGLIHYWVWFWLVLVYRDFW